MPNSKPTNDDSGASDPVGVWNVPPSGLGIWSVFETVSHDDLDAVHAGWSALRFDPKMSSLLNPVARAARRVYIGEEHARGRKVLWWWYALPGLAKGHATCLPILLDDGADGFVIDAEIEFESAGRGAAIETITAVRESVGPDIFIADAPWAWEGFHPNFPALEFSGGATGGPSVDAHLPQNYWSTIGVDVRTCLKKTLDQWATIKKSWPTSAQQPVFPIGTTYGKKELAGKVPPSQVPRLEVTPEDVLWFLDQFGEDDPVSLYSSDRNVRSAAVWDALTKRQRAA